MGLLRPEGLLNCVREMTTAQKAELCQLLDPLGQAIAADIAQGPGPGSPEHAEMFGNSQGPSKIQRDEEFWSRRRGVNPDIPIGISRPLIEMVDIDESIFAGQQVAEPIPPPGQIPESDHEQTLTARWARVNRRWEKLFGETEIPAVRNPDNVLPDLEQIEAMLYDKESKGINPKRCPCCRYVIGCRRKGTL
jgi:hypothetical protein